MLIAHLVPGYFAAVTAQRRAEPGRGRLKRANLWGVALASTAAPDVDVIYNTLFRGFANHSTLWTHSVFVYLVMGAGWWLLRRSGRWRYMQTLVGLVTVGGLSHLLLDVISHGTPLLYPVSLHMFGWPSPRVLQGGAAAYITDPIFLVEPFLIALAAAHWLLRRKLSAVVTRTALVGLCLGLIGFCTAFMLLLPRLRSVLAV